MDTTLARLQVGQLLDGRYRVNSQIARGGMATVYLGSDTRLERTVALKVAHPELANDADFVRRFIDEARSVARLSSPNVVAVYDQGSDGDILFLAMEYVPGQTLRELLTERGRLSPREALDIIEGVLTGLSAAHASGIVHRDVKPENVLLTAAHAVKVADFGLARAAARAGRTQTGMIIGTAAYLAPEQVSHSISDARTDVYATGVMLFELLTGKQPHTGETPLAVAYKHVNEVVPAPSGIMPGLPPCLDALVALATSRDPDLRPADAGQFLQAITEVRRGLPIAGAPAAAGQATAQENGYQPGLPSGSPGSGLPGPVLAGAARTGYSPSDPGGQHSAGQHTSGPQGSSQYGAGQHMSGPQGSGQHSAGQHTSGQHSAGQHTSGQHSAGQHTSGQHSAGQPAYGQTPPDYGLGSPGPARIDDTAAQSGQPVVVSRIIVPAMDVTTSGSAIAAGPVVRSPWFSTARHVIPARCVILARFPARPWRRGRSQRATAWQAGAEQGHRDPARGEQPAG
jgi:serine/threonine protein kinase